MSTKCARIFFIEMMGVTGSFDASVYNHLDDKEDEGAWFVKRFGHMVGVSIQTRNACMGESLPDITEVDGLVLAGSYNSVHDHTDWQQRVRTWIPTVRAKKIPMLGICGAHQLIANIEGCAVEKVPGGPFAGTFPLSLTVAGKTSSKIPVAALDYGNHCYTTQFHPEGSELTLGSIWQHKAPLLMQNYHADDRGDRLVENFLRLVVDQLN